MMKDKQININEYISILMEIINSKDEPVYLTRKYFRYFAKDESIRSEEEDGVLYEIFHAIEDDYNPPEIRTEGQMNAKQLKEYLIEKVTKLQELEIKRSLK